MQNIGSTSPLTAGKIRIGVFGLSEYEIRLVRCVLNLTTAAGRTHSYTLLDPGKACLPDIAIVDAGDVQAKDTLRALTVTNAGRKTAILLFCHVAPTEHDCHFLLRPLAPTRMLAQLDKIADEILGTAASPLPTLMPAVVPKVAVSPMPIAPQSHLLFDEEQLMPARASHRALIIDDSMTARINIDIELRQLRIPADWAKSGELGLQMLGHKSYDIVFLDIVLPGADGYEVCKLMRRNHENKRLPVVMLTSKSSPFDRIRGSLAGCSCYLTKPIEQERFRAVIAKYLVKQDATRFPSGNPQMGVLA